ncbi:MAG TPA: hypothetical protein VIN09_00480 [Chloroflexota bacterium]
MLKEAWQIFPTLSPWVVVVVLTALANAALYHLLLGRDLPRLGAALALGVMGGVLGHLASRGLPAGPWMLGEVHLPLVGVAVWAVLLVARLRWL